jgi:hypothetical protein
VKEIFKGVFGKVTQEDIIKHIKFVVTLGILEMEMLVVM